MNSTDATQIPLISGAVRSMRVFATPTPGQFLFTFAIDDGDSLTVCMVTTDSSALVCFDEFRLCCHLAGILPRKPRDHWELLVEVAACEGRAELKAAETPAPRTRRSK